MSCFLLIESHFPGEGPDVYGFLDLAAQLCRDSHTVDLFLVQNGVLMAQANTDARLEQIVMEQPISVWADDFSLAGRSLLPGDLIPGVQVTGIETLVRLLTRAGCKPIWH